jgi:hypothetical protein
MFVFVYFMVLNATFNNISVMSWRSVLLMVETRGPGENHRPVVSHWQTLSHTSPWMGVEPTTPLAIGTDCIGSCKSNYHAITATTAPSIIEWYIFITVMLNSLSCSFTSISFLTNLQGKDWTERNIDCRFRICL